MHVALAAAAGGEIVFQVGVARGKSGGRQRRASEIGVQDDAGGIDDAAEGRPFERREGGFDAVLRDEAIGGRRGRISARMESRARRISATTRERGKRERAGERLSRAS